MGQKVLLKNVTLAYAALWQATDYDNDGNYKYRATFLVEPNSENDKAIRSAMNKAAAEAWKDDAVVTLRSVSNDKTTMCYRNGDTKKNERYHGYQFLSATRAEKDGRPGVCGLGGPKDRLTEKDGKPYPGCLVNASVDIWGQKGKNEGMRCTVLGIQYVADGVPFSGSPASVDDFEPLGEGSSDLDDFGSIAANEGF